MYWICLVNFPVSWWYIRYPGFLIIQVLEELEQGIGLFQFLMVCSCQALDIFEALIDTIHFLFYLVDVESSTGDQLFSQIIQSFERVLENPMSLVNGGIWCYIDLRRQSVVSLLPWVVSIDCCWRNWLIYMTMCPTQMRFHKRYISNIPLDNIDIMPILLQILFIPR